MNKIWMVVAVSGALLCSSSVMAAPALNGNGAQQDNESQHQQNSSRHHHQDRRDQHQSYLRVGHERGRREGWYHKGGRMPRSYRGQRYQVTDWRAEHLRAPPRGYRWQRSDDGEFLLVAISTGIIAQILLNH